MQGSNKAILKPFQAFPFGYIMKWGEQQHEKEYCGSGQHHKFLYISHKNTPHSLPYQEFGLTSLNILLNLRLKNCHLRAIRKEKGGSSSFCLFFLKDPDRSSLTCGDK